MREDSQSIGVSTVFSGRDEALERRIFRSMLVIVGLAVLVSAVIAPWRVTTGLLLGGALSLFNHHWLRSAVSMALSAKTPGVRPRLRVGRYVLRYLVVFAIVLAAYALNLISLPATLLALCSFVAALFVEAFRQMYFIAIHREETN